MHRALLRHALRVVAVAFWATAMLMLPTRADARSDDRPPTAMRGAVHSVHGRTARPAIEGFRLATAGLVRYAPTKASPGFCRRTGSRRTMRSVPARASLAGGQDNCPLASLHARRIAARAPHALCARRDVPRGAQSSPRAPPTGA